MPRELPTPPPPSDEQLDVLIRMALTEDMGDGGITTSSTIPAEARYVGDFLVKADGVIAGLRVAARVFALLDPAVIFQATVADGDRVASGQVVAGPGHPVGGTRGLEFLVVGHVACLWPCQPA